MNTSALPIWFSSFVWLLNKNDEVIVCTYKKKWMKKIMEDLKELIKDNKWYLIWNYIETPWESKEYLVVFIAFIFFHCTY